MKTSSIEFSLDIAAQYDSDRLTKYLAWFIQQRLPPPKMILLERSVPIVLERPRAVSGAECHEVHQLATQRGVPVQLGFVRRSASLYLKVKEILRSGAIGQILSIQADELVGPFVT